MQVILDFPVTPEHQSWGRVRWHGHAPKTMWADQGVIHECPAQRLLLLHDHYSVGRAGPRSLWVSPEAE